MVNNKCPYCGGDDILQQQHRENSKADAMTEYKDIPGYGGLYGVGRDGTIVSFQKKKPRILMQNIDKKDGCHTVALSRNGVVKRHSVAQLVAQAYIPNPCPDKYECVRTKGDPHDMSADNLKWATKVEHLQTPEVREKAADGIRRSAPHMNTKKIKEVKRRAVYAIDDDGDVVATFRSIQDAKDMLKTQSVGQALRLGCKCSGYYWRYRHESK